MSFREAIIRCGVVSFFHRVGMLAGRHRGGGVGRVCFEICILEVVASFWKNTMTRHVLTWDSNPTRCCQLLQRGRVRREALGLRKAAVGVGSSVPLKSTSLAEFQCFSCWTVPL